jgi:hypothetical protein
MDTRNTRIRPTRDSRNTLWASRLMQRSMDYGAVVGHLREFDCLPSPPDADTRRIDMGNDRVLTWDQLYSRRLQGLTTTSVLVYGRIDVSVGELHSCVFVLGLEEFRLGYGSAILGMLRMGSEPKLDKVEKQFKVWRLDTPMPPSVPSLWSGIPLWIQIAVVISHDSAQVGKGRYAASDKQPTDADRPYKHRP